MAFPRRPKTEVDHNTIELRRLLVQLAARKLEGLRLYRPQPIQQEFHECRAMERVIRGGNRAGKTLCSCVEYARAVTGQDPYDKYPKENGIGYVVGKQGREVAQVLYPMLFKPGAFKIIKDTFTGEWRTFDPENPQDVGRKAEAKPAPALIPKRFVKSIAWEDKKTGLPKIAYLSNGWAIHFYSSESKPTQGASIDLCLFDEEILDRDWYSEVAARLADRGGRFMWSATPQAGTERLYALCERAAEEVEKGVSPRTVVEFISPPHGNRYFAKEDQETFASKFAEDEENYRVRILGEFAILSGRVFPEYSPKIHEIDPRPIPQTWTRYFAVDPGRQVCAVLFVAVPPPEEGDRVYVYDELYLKGCSAAIFGREMGKKSKGQNFQASLIDMTDARKIETGSGKKILEHYSEQLELNRVKTATNGYSFLAGNSNINAGVEAVRFWLQQGRDGPKLRVFRTCVHFIKEIKHWRNKQVKGIFIDKPEDRNDHLMSTLRYLAQYGPTWVQPKALAAKHSPAYAYFKKRQQKEKSRNGSINFGPGNPNATSEIAF